jgi:WD40 repeat protein
MRASSIVPEGDAAASQGSRWTSGRGLGKLRTKQLGRAGTGDWAVTLWDVATHRLVGRLPLPIFATTVAFDPRGKLLAASANDGTVYLFDVASRREIGTSLPGDGLSVPAFDPAGTHLIVVYQFGAVVVWDIDPERWKQQACTVAGRSLTREEWRELLPGRRYQPPASSPLTAPLPGLVGY